MQIFDDNRRLALADFFAGTIATESLVFPGVPGLRFKAKVRGSPKFKFEARVALSGLVLVILPRDLETVRS